MVAAEGGQGLDADGLRAAVADLFATRLDRDLPLWRIDVVPFGRGDRAALVWRIHHALADGTAAMRFAHSVLWDEAPAARTAGAHKPRPQGRDDARRRGRLAGFLEREFAGSQTGRSPFDGEIGTRREVAFASTPLQELHDAAKSARRRHPE